MFRMLSRVLVVFAVAMLIALPAVAADRSHDGTVVTAGNGKLIMTGKDNKEHSHNIGPSVKITINGKEAKLQDLKGGQRITVGTDEDGNVKSVSTQD